VWARVITKVKLEDGRPNHFVTFVVPLGASKIAEMRSIWGSEASGGTFCRMVRKFCGKYRRTGKRRTDEDEKRIDNGRRQAAIGIG
jgi:hypothetical protein